MSNDLKEKFLIQADLNVEAANQPQAKKKKKKVKKQKKTQSDFTDELGLISPEQMTPEKDDVNGFPKKEGSLDG